MNLRHGIFDDASLSIISSATLSAICGKAGVLPDARRFRPNIVVEADSQEPFLEDRWIGGTLLFGNGSDSAAVAVTAHDVRCMIINLDPDSAIQNPDVLKTVVRTNDNKAGVYGTVVRTGTVRVGDPVQLNFRSE